MREHVKEFAEAMEKKLQKHDDDYGEKGWLDGDCDVLGFKNLLTMEMKELYESFGDCDPEGLMDKCIGVANFVMMIRSRIIKRRSKPMSKDNTYVKFREECLKDIPVKIPSSNELLKTKYKYC